jgi:hypothetical protein
MMKYALLAAPLFAFVVGCNTAQVSTPPLLDAGPPCPTRAAIFTCEAGAPSPTDCTGGATLNPIVGQGTDAGGTVPAGSYVLGCTISFWVQDVASSDCLPTEPCTCVAPDAGADGGTTSAAGVWTCALQ